MGILTAIGHVARNAGRGAVNTFVPQETDDEDQKRQDAIKTAIDLLLGKATPPVSTNPPGSGHGAMVTLPQDAGDPGIGGGKLPTYEPDGLSQPVYDPPQQQADSSAPTPLPQETTPRIVYNANHVPMGVEGDGDQLSKDEAYLRAQQAYDPKNHNSRFKSGLITGGRGFEREGLLGGLFGLVRGFVDPSTDERFHRDREIARTQVKVGDEYDRRKKAADINYRNAEAQRVLHPVYAPDVVDSESGQVLVNKNTATYKPIYNPQTKQPLSRKPRATGAKTEVIHNAETGRAEKWLLDENGNPTEKLAGWSDPARDLVKRDGMWVPQGTALTAAATASARDEARSDRRDARAEHRTERSEDKGEAHQKEQQARREKAASIAGEIADANAQAAQYDQVAQGTADKETRTYYESLREGAKHKGVAKAKELREGYGDFYEAETGENGWAYAKPRPFSVKNWRASYPNATKQQENAAKANAKAAGIEVVE